MPILLERGGRLEHLPGELDELEKRGHGEICKWRICISGSFAMEIEKPTPSRAGGLARRCGGSR
jgi:hypothetical protein